MKQLRSLTGGYRRSQEYLLDIQDELTQMGNALFGSLGYDVVLSGCDVTSTGVGTVNIAAGLVFVGGVVMRFDGAVGIASNGTKIITTGTPVTSNPQPFANPPGSTQDVYTEIKAIVGGFVSGANSQLVINTALLTFEDYLNMRAPKGSIKEFVFDNGSDDTAFLAKFDITGLGISPDMYGWALMNGVADTINAGGSVFIGVGILLDPNTNLVNNYTMGQIGGEATHPLALIEMPSHTHAVEASDNETSNGSLKKPAWSDNETEAEGTFNTEAAGGDPAAGNATKPHNNMQPYIAVYKVRKIK